jgi:hypothetical protein
MRVLAVEINPTIYPPAGSFATLGDLISVVIRNVYVLASVLLLILLIVGGLGVIMGAGSGDSQKTGEGANAVTAAIIGFLIIFASYWIIQIIEAITGVDILKAGL